MSLIGDRVHQARKELGISQAELARRIGVTRKAVSKIEAGDTAEPKAETVERLAEALGKEYSWLRHGAEISESVSDSTADYGEGSCAGLVSIPAFRARASAGAGLVNYDVDQIPGGFFFKRASIEQRGLPRDRLRCIFAGGESMSPTIEDGDMIVMQEGVDRIIDGGVYVIRWVDEIRIKRLSKLIDGRLSVRSDNPDKNRFPDETIDPEAEGFEILGRVQWRGGWI